MPNKKIIVEIKLNDVVLEAYEIDAEIWDKIYTLVLRPLETHGKQIK